MANQKNFEKDHALKYSPNNDDKRKRDVAEIININSIKKNLSKTNAIICHVSFSPVSESSELSSKSSSVALLLPFGIGSFCMEILDTFVL